MLQLSILTRDQVTLLSNWVAAWKKGSNGSITITPSDVFSAEIDLIKYGLPPSSVQTLQQLGADAATIEAIKNRFTVQDVYAVAGTFPDLLTDISLINALNQSADAFLAAALNNAVPLAPHQQVKGEGIVSDNVADATFEFEARVNSSGKLTSEVHLQAHSATYNFRITTGSITHAALLGNVAVLDGTYSASDATSGTFRIIATDIKGDEGKGKDTVDISFSNGFHLSGVVNKGEIQIRTEVED
jgi:hypothetical protein